MSGSGKTSTINFLEDMGYFCIDNLPPQLTTELVRVLSDANEAADDGDRKTSSKIAVVMDVRNPTFVSHLADALMELKQMEIGVRILFLDASDEDLISRYNQSRRSHPMERDRSLCEAIRLERALLVPVRQLATEIIDTSGLSPTELRDRLFALVKETGETIRMTLFLQSFGFKYGVPTDCDNLYDVRFIPNPFYLDDLRPLSGLDEPVRAYINGFEESQRFLSFLCEFYDFTVPYYIREGKSRLHIGIGCTGGRHRSVMLSEALAQRLREKGFHVVLNHRDLRREGNH